MTRKSSSRARTDSQDGGSAEPTLQPEAPKPAIEVPAGPVSIPIPELTPSNQVFLGMVMRRLRGILVEAQQCRADGRVGIDVPISAGNLQGTIRIRPDWHERLPR